MSGHTRGPWTYEYNNADSSAGGQWYSIIGADDCDLLHFAYNSSMQKQAECKANARLIASTPELLAALVDLRERYVDVRYSEFSDSIEDMREWSWFAAIEAAIAKATA